MKNRSSCVCLCVCLSNGAGYSVRFGLPLFHGKMAACPSSWGKLEQQNAARRFVFIMAAGAVVVVAPPSPPFPSLPFPSLKLPPPLATKSLDETAELNTQQYKQRRARPACPLPRARWSVNGPR